MRVRETRARLRLELVAGEVLGLEGEGVREIRIEVGGALARDAVDEIERDVVKTGITESVNRAPDVIGRCLALEDVEERRPERLRAHRHAVDAVLEQERSQLRASRSPGSPRPSARRRRAAPRAAGSSARGSVNVGVPPPTNTVSSVVGEPRIVRARARRGVRRRTPDARATRPTAVTKSQYPQRWAQNGRWT